MKNRTETTPCNPLPPQRIQPSYRLWPRGYFICAVLWNQHGKGNYSQDNVACAKL